MKLVIVESPTKQRTINRYLGKGYTTSSSLGHIRDLSKKGKSNLGIDVDQDFEPDYIVLPGKQKVVANLIKSAENAEEIYLATDPDREGEAISWHLAQVLNLDLQKTKRLEFHEITPYGIKHALENPKTINLDLVASQETRRMLDRIIGFRLSNLLRDKIQSQSAGRVQSAVLKLIVDRERGILAFVPQKYFQFYANMKYQKKTYGAQLIAINGAEVDRFDSKEQLEEIASSLKKELIVKEVESKVKDYYARPPFTTSSLQQEAFSLFKFSPKKTMSIAKELYEGVDLKECQQGIITYIRTDSIRINPAFINAVKKEIGVQYGEDYIGKAYVQKQKENMQDAHEAIRPTNLEFTPEKVKSCLTPDQWKLYELIYLRTMASMMKPRVNLETKVIFEQDDKQFQLQGKTIQFEGFSKAYRKFEKLSEDKIQSFVVGQQYEVDNYEIKEKETKPPFRYNSGSIVRTMEELGIGRPSTYVATLETLQKRNYIQYKAGTISPSDQGMLTTDKLSQFFDHLVDATYTALMEKQLDEIENGKVDKINVLQQFYQDFESKLAHAQLHMEKIKPERLDEDCPVCGKKLMIRKGKFGDFVGCSGYPDCTYIRSQTKEIPDNAKTCPKCKQGKLIMRKGKYGNFLACNRYPDCDYVEKFKNFTKKT